MTTIEKKILEKYENAGKLIELVREYDLENVINKAIQQIESKIRNKKTQDLPRLSGIILNDINSLISKINDPGKKKQIEYLLSDIFQEYLKKISEEENSQTILSEIQEGIRTACDYSGYDYDKLSAYLNIEKQQVLLPRKNRRDIYYDWNGEVHELDELARHIYDMKLILSVKEFKRLFSPVSGHLSLKCNQEYTDKLLVLFQILKERKLITPKGKGNSGHFTPFVQYSTDNEGNFLIEKSANKEHEKLKRNKAKYQKLREKMEGVVNGIVNKPIRQPRDNDRYPLQKGK
ncbi:MAG: hypothetical protein JNM88_01355 [Chitinophagaceae bacterium]|nr:hypothetical protein [Chitinophagaceae bacterium]